MKKIVLSSFVIYIFSITSSFANYTTPGTGDRFTLDNLVTNSAGDVTFSSGAYNVNDTIIISLNDTLAITTDAVVKFAVGTFFDVNGTIVINPPNNVLFTAQNTIAGYLGMRLNASTASTLKKLTFEYAVSLRLSDCNPIIDSCTFQYNNNNASTTFGNGAIALFRSNATITNCKFLNNQRAAIQGGGNISNAPKIINCLFMGNNTTNQNVPQINLGASGSDTVRILNNQILRSSNRSGGIGFLPIGDVFAVITGNTIKNNRYGITFNGGSNINTIVSYNIIDSNNTEGLPLAGGSGIAFSGGNSSSHQNAVVTGNYIRWNLWGITIGPTSATAAGGAMPNLGNITNADTSDNGKNWIYGNTNSTTPFIDLYNNNVDNIFAQNNFWGTANPDTIEARIFHKPDSSALGLVNYSGFITLPVELTAFNASTTKNSVTLTWKTKSENNTSYFDIEKSDNSRSFYSIGKVNSVGTSSSDKNYTFADKNITFYKQIYYRLKLVDKDNSFKYSNVIAVKLNEAKADLVKLYPTVITAAQTLNAEVLSAKAQTISIQFINNEGKQLAQISKTLIAGNNTFSFTPKAVLPNGILQVRFVGEGLNKTITIIKN